MFLISKLVEFLLLPSNLIGFIAGFGLLALLLRRPRLGHAALVIAALLLAIGGWSPLGRAALMVLEDRFPRPQLAEPVAGIIMLGGAVDTHITAERGEPTLNEAGERINAMAELSRQFPRARLLLSGGANHVLTAQPVTESAVARDLLIGLGVDPQRIELEERSRTTCENAEQSLLVAKPNEGDRWVLVTSASHMARAMACFRAVGFSVIPYPVDYRTRGAADLRRPVDSIADGLQVLDLAAHEWIGLVTYRLSGQTRELFPAP
jgi:uncharacterized SAM-binding protein YcdF (DUF218 family)